MRIYDGDVKARVEKAMSVLHMLPDDLEKTIAEGLANGVSDLPTTYNTKGWQDVAYVIATVNRLAWRAAELGHDEYAMYYSELYHAACAWYQGYPANAYEEEHADSDGCFDHVSEEDMVNIYKYLD